MNTKDENQRSAISLDKGRYENSASENGMKIMHPENSHGEEIYPKGYEPQIQQQTASDAQTVYAESQDLNEYFRYETADGNALPAAAQQTKPSADFTEEIAGTICRIQHDKKFYKKLMKFPYPLFAATAFLGMGGLFNLWHPMWMIFLTIPLYYTTIEALYKKNANIFCFPVFVTLLYLISGFAFNMWHPGWLAFLSIPFYYWLVNLNGKNDDSEDEKENKKK